MKRNFIGYGENKPKISWPNKTNLAVSIVVNIEEGAELSVSSGDSENEYVYENNKKKLKMVIKIYAWNLILSTA